MRNPSERELAPLIGSRLFGLRQSLGHSALGEHNTPVGWFSGCTSPHYMLTLGIFGRRVTVPMHGSGR
jgi:hypothetical protein